MFKRKVLQIVGDPVGGIRKHVHDIIMGLDTDFDLYYISSNHGDKKYTQDVDKIHSIVVKLCKLHIAKKPSIHDLVNVFKIYQFIRSNNIDVVHGHGAKGGVYARISGRLAGCKVIYTPHGGVVHNMFGRTESILYKVVESCLCYFTDLLIFESNYTAIRFMKKYGCTRTNNIVNYNGVSPPDPEEMICNKMRDTQLAIKVGIFGVLRKEKGQQLALKAIKSLVDKGVNIQLFFYGDGPLKITLQNEIRKCELSDSVFLCGEVDDVNYYMQQVDFVLIPSLFESFGYVAVEAMLMKKNIISSSAGGLVEILQDDFAFMYDSHDSTGLEQAIVRAINCSNSILIEKRVKGYEQAICLFGIEKMLRTLKKHYA